MATAETTNPTRRSASGSDDRASLQRLDRTGNNCAGQLRSGQQSTREEWPVTGGAQVVHRFIKYPAFRNPIRSLLLSEATVADATSERPARDTKS